jgi:hypothetical protein
MIKDGKGGGNTKTGLNFEHERNVLSVLEKAKGYVVKGEVIYYKNKEVAKSFRKNALYKFLASKKVDYKKLISKKLLPDEAIYVITNNILFVIEMKFQTVAGSVDEKLQTCDFKKKQYTKLMSSINIDVEYIYILNDWFKKPEYKDTLDYVISVGCHYYFHYLPLKKLGLPVPSI